MADQPVTREKLINADIDVENLGKAVNELGVVNPRYGDTYKTLPQIASEYEQNGATRGFNTRAEFDAVKTTIPAYTVVNIAEAGENQGQNIWNGTTLTKSPYDPLTQSKDFTLAEILKYFESISTRTGWAFPFVDSIKQILGGFDSDGKFWAENVPVVEKLTEALQRIGNAENITFLTSDPLRTGVVFSILDEQNHLLMHLASDFTLYIAGIPAGVSNELINQVESISTSLSAINSSLNPLSTFVAVGDSKTEGAGSTDGKTYPYYVAQALGRSVSNQGIGGQDAARISARLNGTTVLVTLPNNQIPADTSPVAVTLSIPLLTTPATTAARTRKVWINGVYGTLSKDTSNSYTFARDVAGEVVNVAPNSAMIIDTGDFQNRIALIWMGTNNSFATEADRKAIIDHIDATIAALKPLDKKYLVLSPWKPSTNIKGSEVHNQILEMHKMMAAKYKDRFVNVWWDLICSYDPGTPQDVIDFANEVTPSSKMADSTHPNSDGYQVVAQSVFSKITQLGW